MHWCVKIAIAWMLGLLVVVTILDPIFIGIIFAFFSTVASLVILLLWFDGTLKK